MNTILGFLAFCAAIIGLFISSKATIGLALIAAFYVMFKVSYCLRVLEHQERIEEQNKELLKAIKQASQD